MNKIKKAYHIYRRDGIIGVFRGGYNSLSQGPLLPINIQYKYWKNRIVYRYEAVAKPLNLIWVSPEDIEYLTGTDHENSRIRNPSDLLYARGLPEDHPEYKYILRGSFKPNKCIGTITGGVWDRPENKFSELYVYQAIKDHFKHGVPWEETTYFSLVSDWMDNGYVVRNCSTVKEYQDVLEHTDKIYQDIRDNGYKTQEELTGRSSLHEIGVNIGRDGRLLFNSSGHHRLSISKVLDLDEIPVLVIARHQQWQNIREEISNCSNIDQLSSVARQAVINDHPDVQDLIK